MKDREEFEQWYEYTTKSYRYSHKDIAWKVWQRKQRQNKGWLKEQLSYAKEQVKDLPEFKREPFFQSSENIMSNVTNLKKNITPSTAVFDFLLWESQDYYTIYKDGKPLMHCHFENVDADGLNMAGVYVMKQGESIFKLDFAIELVEVAEKSEFELGDLLVRLMDGDQYQQTHLFVRSGAACNQPKG